MLVVVLAVVVMTVVVVSVPRVDAELRARVRRHVSKSKIRVQRRREAGRQHSTGQARTKTNGPSSLARTNSHNHNTVP